MHRAAAAERLLRCKTAAPKVAGHVPSTLFSQNACRSCRERLEAHNTRQREKWTVGGRRRPGTAPAAAEQQQAPGADADSADPEMPDAVTSFGMPSIPRSAYGVHAQVGGHCARKSCPSIAPRRHLHSLLATALHV